MLHGLHHEARSAMQARGRKVRSHFQVRSLSEYDNTVHLYLLLIVLKGLLLSFIKFDVVPKFSRFNLALSRRTVQEVIVKLLELV